MRYVIPCAGNGARWAVADGRPKHLVMLRGEPILHRTVRLINELDPDADVRIVVKSSRDADYLIDGSSRTQAKLDPSRGQADKVLSSVHAWSASERTVVLYGDVYFTDEAMASIVGNDDPWTAFCRFGRSEFSGCDHAELFGFAFDPDERDRIRDAAETVVRLHRAGVLSGYSGGWQIFTAAAGVPDDAIQGATDPAHKARNLGHAVVIDDWTDDFDYERDWHRWCYRWAKADEATRAVGHESTNTDGPGDTIPAQEAGL